MLRFLTAGESHGKGLTAIIDGMPAGVPINTDLIAADMARRRHDAGRGGRGIIEKDLVEITAGVRFGKSIGAPIVLWIPNADATNWGDKMSEKAQDAAVVESAKVTNPRPGHADLAGIQKYGFDDARNVLERSSARETTARVAAGSIFRQLLSCFDIEIASHTLAIGEIKLESDYSFVEIKNVFEFDPDTRCVDPGTGQKMQQAIYDARINKNTLGGVVEIWAVGVPVGLGSYVQHDRKIDGQIAGALMSIQSVKGVEIGTAHENSTRHGSDVHDPIEYKEGAYKRKSNRAGGIEGGVTNGEPIIARVHHKPISTLYNPLQTVNIATKQTAAATIERSDICVVPRAGIVSESMLAYVIAKNLLEKFGEDALEDILSSYSLYKKRLS